MTHATHAAIAARIVAEAGQDLDAIRKGLRAAYIASPEYARFRLADETCRYNEEWVAADEADQAVYRIYWDARVAAYDAAAQR